MDIETGLTIDILFADDDWQMVIPMPDPLTVREFDEDLGAYFLDLHSLVQLKTAVYLSKRDEFGEDVAAKDRSDVYELIHRNLGRFGAAIIDTFPSQVRAHCMEAYRAAVRVSRHAAGPSS